MSDISSPCCAYCQEKDIEIVKLADLGQQLVARVKDLQHELESSKESNLHAEIQNLYRTVENLSTRNRTLEAQRDSLDEALKRAQTQLDDAQHVQPTSRNQSMASKSSPLFLVESGGSFDFTAQQSLRDSIRRMDMGVQVGCMDCFDEGTQCDGNDTFFDDSEPTSTCSASLVQMMPLDDASRQSSGLHGGGQQQRTPAPLSYSMALGASMAELDYTTRSNTNRQLMNNTAATMNLNATRSVSFRDLSSTMVFENALPTATATSVNHTSEEDTNSTTDVKEPSRHQNPLSHKLVSDPQFARKINWLSKSTAMKPPLLNSARPKTTTTITTTTTRSGAMTARANRPQPSGNTTPSVTPRVGTATAMSDMAQQTPAIPRPSLGLIRHGSDLNLAMREVFSTGLSGIQPNESAVSNMAKDEFRDFEMRNIDFFFDTIVVKKVDTPCDVCACHTMRVAPGEALSETQFLADVVLAEAVSVWKARHDTRVTYEEAWMIDSLSRRIRTLPLWSVSCTSHEGYVSVWESGTLFDRWVRKYAVIRGVFLFVFSGKDPESTLCTFSLLRGASVRVIRKKRVPCLKIEPLSSNTDSSLSPPSPIYLSFNSLTERAMWVMCLRDVSRQCPHKTSMMFTHYASVWKALLFGSCFKIAGDDPSPRLDFSPCS